MGDTATDARPAHHVMHEPPDLVTAFDGGWRIVRWVGRRWRALLRHLGVHAPEPHKEP